MACSAREGLRPTRRWRVSLAVCFAVLATTLFAAGCTTTPPAQKPLAASQPAEATLRSLRLVGIDTAAVGEKDGTVTLRMEVPSISSAGDIEIAWQSGVGVLTASYPKARRYVVRLTSSAGEPLVEYEVSGPEARELVGNADSMRPSARFLVDGEDAMPAGALAIGTNMGDGVVSGDYLDAKNRAALPTPERGKPASYALLGKREAAATRLAVPGRPAPAVDQDAASVLAGVLRDLLARPAASAVEGADALRALADSAGSGPERVLALRRWIAVAEATTAEKPFGDVTPAANETARAVHSAKMPALNDEYQGGRRASAVLAAAQVPGAPANMTNVARFATSEKAHRIDLRYLQAETTPTAGESPDDQLATIEALATRFQLEMRGDGSVPAVSWETSAGVQSVASPVWIAYLRPDGRIFWLLGEGGPAALTDASLDGWAWSARRVDVVDSADVGRVLSTIELR